MNKKTNRVRLVELMRTHKKTHPEIGSLLRREAQTVRAWTCGARDIPDDALDLLELKLSTGAAIEQAAPVIEKRKEPGTDETCRQE